MKFSRLVPALLVLLAASGCGDGGSSKPDTASTSSTSVVVTSTLPVVAVSTTTPVTTAASTSTSTSTTSTSTTSTSTTTTVPIGAELVLRANGLGSANFGTDPDGVVAYAAAILGPPTSDSGWIDPLAYGACSGTELRVVIWGDLTLLFGDDSNVTQGRRHFFNYVYGPAAPGAQIAPSGLKTEAGVGVGTTVAELKGTYPSAVVNPADEFAGPTFFINAGLAGFVTGVADTDTVTSIVGGQGCGE